MQVIEASNDALEVQESDILAFDLLYTAHELVYLTIQAVEK
jgi:hypothetical protein